MREVLRQEKKFPINLIDRIRIQNNVGAILPKDSHSGLGGYMIRSLYFDTLDDRDFNDKVDGLELRRKIRLRIYDPKANFAMLEMKQKEGQYQRKRSLRLSREDAIELIDNNYEVLLKYNEPFALECYSLMRNSLYRAKTVVEYNRLAYTLPTNSIRITIDSDIRANEANLNIFDEDLILYPVMDPNFMVLEVKYNGFLLSYVKSTLDILNRSEVSVSKYCLARSISKGLG